MKKPRILEFDFIRAIAVISIVVIHFNAIYLYTQPQRYDLMMFGGTQISNIYIGGWGVSLFFILSGASLMYVYGGDNFKLSTFYKKRFLGIYPMFWLAYFFGFLLLFWINHGNSFTGVPKIRFLLTIIGFDGNLATIISTYYILGEWFLGCIIALYVIFPLMRLLINKIPKISVIIILVVFCLMEFVYKGPLPKDVIFLTRLPEFCFGMYFIKYIKRVNIPTFIISLAVIVANWIIKPDFILQDIQVIYIGITSFLALYWIGKWIMKISPARDISCFLSKYSYAIFLTHHIIISLITGMFNLQSLSWLESFTLFLLCCTVALISSVLLYILEKTIMTPTKCYIDNVSNILFKKTMTK